MPLEKKSHKLWKKSILSRVHKVNLSCYVALHYTHQPFMSALSQEHGHPTLSCRAPQSTDYLQGYTLYVSNNYLLVFFLISKLYIISNFIYKLLAIIYKVVIICKGCNNLYQQGPATPSPRNKYQVPSTLSTHFTLTLHIQAYTTLTFIRTHLRRTHSHLFIYLFFIFS